MDLRKNRERKVIKKIPRLAGGMEGGKGGGEFEERKDGMQLSGPRESGDGSRNQAAWEILKTPVYARRKEIMGSVNL